MNQYFQERVLIENYYDIQSMRIEAQNRITNWFREHYTKEDVIKLLKKYGINEESKPYAKLTELCMKNKIEIPDEVENLVEYAIKLYDSEKWVKKVLDEATKSHPLRKEYLNKIRGIGPVLATGLIAWLSPIERFSNVSKLWKYSGLAPDSKREKGKKLNYNPKLKTFMWKVGASFVKQPPQKSFYRRMYDEFKKYYEETHDEKCPQGKDCKARKMHIHLMAQRRTVKLFVSHLWEVWRKMEGLPVGKPYPIAILGHSDYIPPQVDVKPPEK